MTPTQRLALVNAAIVAVRPYGHLAETVLEPLMTLRDDLGGPDPGPPAGEAREAAERAGDATWYARDDDRK